MSDENIQIIEKKKLKKQFNGLAGILIGYSSMAYVVMFGYTMIKVIGIAIHNFENQQMMEQHINEVILSIMSNGILSIIGVLLGMIFILLYRKKQFFTYDLVHVNHKMNSKTLLLLFICLMAPQFLFGITSELFESILNRFGYSILESMNFLTEGSQSWSMFIYVVLIGPIAEEFVFRGAVLRSLEKHGKVFAIIISAILLELHMAIYSKEHMQH